jgi:hypothetical protein
VVDLCQILTEICITQFDIVVDLRPPRQRWRNTFGVTVKSVDNRFASFLLDRKFANYFCWSTPDVSSDVLGHPETAHVPLIPLNTNSPRSVSIKRNEANISSADSCGGLGRWESIRFRSQEFEPFQLRRVGGRIGGFCAAQNAKLVQHSDCAIFFLAGNAIRIY